MTNIPLVLLLGIFFTMQAHLAKALERRGIEVFNQIKVNLQRSGQPLEGGLKKPAFKNQSLIAMTVGTTANAEVARETTKVFSYQPGESLLIMSTFAMNEPKANVRQRVGYFGLSNGIYLENDGTTNYFVLRTNTSSTVTETRVAQSDWNVDKFDTTGYSAQSGGAEHTGGLDVSKTNILWMDIEWLGVGDVRCGFVVDGKMLPAHIFHNDNNNIVPYMTTATLPLRYEIKNTGVTTSNSTLKQICSTWAERRGK